MSMLDILRKNKKVLLVAELSAFLHDLDKATPAFLEKADNHSLKSLFTGNKYRDNQDTVPIRKRLQWRDYNLNPIKADLGIALDSLRPVFEEVLLAKPATIAVEDAFVFHHDNDPQEPHPLLSHLLHAALGGCDGIDSALDKDGAFDPQPQAGFVIDSPFGAFERNCETKFDEALKILRKLQGDDLDAIAGSIEELREVFMAGLGQTLYPCNDVTLWAHSYSVAVMTVALMAKVLLEFHASPHNAEDRYLLPQRYDRRKGRNAEVADTADFAFCKVTFDRSFLWSQAEKAGDVSGIAHQVLQLQDTVRDQLEKEISIGREMYRDQERVLFLMPKLPDQQAELEATLHGELERSIVARLVGMQCHELPFSISFESATANDEKDVAKRILKRSKQVLRRHEPCLQSVTALLKLTETDVAGGPRCRVCGIRPEVQHAENHLCTACDRRRSDVGVFSRRKLRAHDYRFTLDLKEILKASGGNRLALLRLSFDLQPLFESTVFDKVKWQHGNMEWAKNPSPGRLYRCWETLSSFLAACRDIAGRECSCIFPVTLDPTPDRMEFVIAGAKAMRVITAIYKEYEKRFGKFRECLPLSVGCVFFYQKFPLYVVMDAARGMADAFSQPREETWTVRGELAEEENATVVQLETANQGNKGQLASLAEWRVNPYRSDDKIDIFHPWFNGKLVNQLCDGDTINVREGYFDFILAESAESRFAFAGSEGERRHHILGSRPSYPLAAIPEFVQVWDLLKKLPKHQRGNIESLLVEKINAWGDAWWNDEDTARKFCRTVLFAPNAFGKKNLTEQERTLLENAAWNGVLLDVLDLYMHLIGETNEAPAPACAQPEGE